MAGLSFQEKLKNKLSTVGKQGELSMSQARAVAGQLPESKSHFKYAAAAVMQTNATVLQTNAPVLQKEELVFAKPIRVTRKVIRDTYSECAAPVRFKVADVATSETAAVSNRKVSHSIDFQHPVTSSPQSVHPASPQAFNPRKQTKSTDFTPYTLQDYRKIKPIKYSFLGGLGPANKETPEWKLRFKLHRRRLDYGKRQPRSAKDTPSMLRYSCEET